MKKDFVVLIISLLLILLFIHTGVAKLADFSKFKVQLGKSPFITNYSGPIVWVIPILEILTSGLLAFSKTRIWGLYISFFMMTMFTVYIYMMINYADSLPCSCGGVIEGLNWEQHLWFNIVFSILAFIGVMLSNVRDDSSRNPPTLI